MGNAHSNTEEEKAFNVYDDVDDDEISVDIYEVADKKNREKRFRNCRKLFFNNEVSDGSGNNVNSGLDKIRSFLANNNQCNKSTEKSAQKLPLVDNEPIGQDDYSEQVPERCNANNQEHIGGQLVQENDVELDHNSGLPVNSVSYLERQEWFFTGLTRKDANAILYKKVNPQGSFLLRPSDTYLGDFSLAVKDGKRICHYLLRRLTSGRFLSSVRLTFPSMLSLISYYVDDDGALEPCIDSIGKERIKRQKSQFETKDIDDDETMNHFLSQPYYYGEMDRYDAERLLFEEGKSGRNLYLIRKSKNCRGEFVLSIKEGNEVIHFLLPDLRRNGLIIARKYTEFYSLRDIVEHYSLHADGLCAKLTTPAIAD